MVGTLVALLVGLPLPTPSVPPPPVALPTSPVLVQASPLPQLPSLTVSPSPSLPTLPTLPSLPTVPSSAPTQFPVQVSPPGAASGPPPAPSPTPAPGATPAPSPQPATAPLRRVASRDGVAVATKYVPGPVLRLPPGPAGQALAAALLVLPALAVIWLLALLRTFERSRQWRSAALRLAVAGELGVRPRDLAAMPAKALVALRSQLAFDELTGVLRRPAGMAALEREMSRARRHRRPLAVAFADLDGLKALNDSRGHAAGDGLLQRAGAALRDGLRGEDVVFRFGGDEFVCILPDTTAAAAGAVLERIQAGAASGGCSFCVGIAELAQGDDEVSLLARADDRLYSAKAARPDGRGRPPAPRHRPRERLRVT